MPQRVPDIWAWWRTYLSPTGPKPIMRLVLDGHMRRMNHDGKGCWAGVRDLAEITGLNKDTVATQRERALQAGWLVEAPAAEAQHTGELWAAVPDSIEIDPQPERSRQRQSRGAVNSRGTVRRDRTNCPMPSDVSLQNSIPLQRDGETGQRNSSVDNTARELANSRELRLLAWLATDPQAKAYRHDIDSLERLAPVGMRFDGYQRIIRNFVQQPSGDDDRR